jgi:hypothetical protein
MVNDEVGISMVDKCPTLSKSFMAVENCTPPSSEEGDDIPFFFVVVARRVCPSVNLLISHCLIANERK